MNSYLYELCDNEGYSVLDIITGFTKLTYAEYYKKHIVPLLSELSATHNKQILVDARK